VVIDPSPEEGEDEVRLSVVKPKKQKTPVGVGAEGGAEELPEGGEPPAEDSAPVDESAGQ
jgi:hypothetical protein